MTLRFIFRSMVVVLMLAPVWMNAQVLHFKMTDEGYGVITSYSIHYTKLYEKVLSDINHQNFSASHPKFFLISLNCPNHTPGTLLGSDSSGLSVVHFAMFLAILGNGM